MTEPIQPADVRAFLRALRLAEEKLAVDIDGIALVEAAWEIADTIVSSNGWVLALDNGRRLYVEYMLDYSGDPLAEEIEVRTLLPGETYPALKNEAGVLWYRPDKINEHLGITDPSLH